MGSLSPEFFHPFKASSLVMVMQIKNNYIIALFFLIALILCAWYYWQLNQKDPNFDIVSSKYDEMRRVLANSNTNGYHALIAPNYQLSWRKDQLLKIPDFAKPLTKKSLIRIADNHATICPIPVLYFGLLPWGGHRIELVKEDGQWYFTGRVHID